MYCQFSHCRGDCGDLAGFVTSLVQAKLCLLQTIPHCKGEQNYGGVTLFVGQNDSKCSKL